MTVKEVIELSADLVGVKESVSEYLAQGGENGKSETDTLLGCYRLVENALALDYFPLIAEEKVSATDGEVAFSSLARQVTHVLRVQNAYGASLAFRLFPLSLKTDAGDLQIRYAYAPTEKGLQDDTETAPAVSARLIAYGVASEYCLAKGFYEEASVWENRFKQALACAYGKRKVKKTAARRWV